MRVITLVPPDVLVRIAAALGRTASVAPARDVAQLVRELTAGGSAAVVIDPRLVPAEAVAAFTRAAQKSGVAVIVHTALTATAMRAVLPIAHAGVREVLIRDVDDSPASMRRVFDRLADDTIGVRVLTRLAPTLSRMPKSLRDAVLAMFAEPSRFDTPERLAARAGMKRRSLDRWVARSEVVSARLLVAAPKLMLVYGQLRHADASVSAIAERLGYGSPRSLERQCVALLGIRPVALRSEMDPDTFVAALVRGLLTTRATPAGAGPRATSLPAPR